MKYTQTAPRQCHRDQPDEQGNITVLTFGWLVIIGMLVVVVVNSSAAYLARQEMTSLADQVALHAADGLDTAVVYQGGLTDRAELDLAHAERLIAGTTPADVYVQLQVNSDTVTVRLERTITLPLSPPGWPLRTTVRASGFGQLKLSSS